MKPQSAGARPRVRPAASGHRIGRVLAGLLLTAACGAAAPDTPPAAPAEDANTRTLQTYP